MTIALFYDSETTGLPLYDRPSDHHDQPHLAQLGACLVDMDTRKVISTIDVIIRPKEWTIPAEVSAIHGITNEMAMDVGIDEKDAVSMLFDLAQGRVRIGHNEQFDARILRCALKRYFAEPAVNAWKNGLAECTQILSTPILKLPPTAKMKAAGRHHFKTANLGESYQHFTGKPLENAHSALADVHGCMAVYFAIQDLNKQTA